MAEPVPDAKSLLRDDLSKEYYAILGVVSSYDGWLLIVKGWSVTLSLAALGLGFQQRHFALFMAMSPGPDGRHIGAGRAGSAGAVPARRIQPGIGQGGGPGLQERRGCHGGTA